MKDELPGGCTLHPQDRCQPDWTDTAEDLHGPRSSDAARGPIPAPLRKAATSLDPRVSAVIGPRAAAAATQGYLARLLAEGPRGVRAKRGGVTRVELDVEATIEAAGEPAAAGGGAGGRGARRAEAPEPTLGGGQATPSRTGQSRRSKKMETEVIERRDLGAGRWRGAETDECGGVGSHAFSTS